MKIKFTEDFKSDGIGSGFGVGSVLITTDEGEVIEMDWDENNPDSNDVDTPSPYEDPYGFLIDVLEVCGIYPEVSIEYVDQS